MAPPTTLLLALLLSLTRAASALYYFNNGTKIAPCDVPLYCYGDILKSITVDARPYTDTKVFVDLPTKKPLKDVLAAYDKLKQPLSNNSELDAFLSANFAPAGSELQSVPASQLKTDPVFLTRVNDTVVKEFVKSVVGFWPSLTRRYAPAANCTGCASSFIPLKRPFVVAGDRFREVYYWDSYWIVLGLLRTQGNFTGIAKNTIENFLDLVEKYGFVPNGARIYYLNRSQPPLLTQMLNEYVQYTNDTSLLKRAVPLLIKEHDFWMKNRTVSVKVAGKTYKLNQYNVTNTEPRPESWREDFITNNNKSYYSASGIVYPETVSLTEPQKMMLLRNIASTAESGWDFSSRWIARPGDAGQDIYFPLRSLNTVNIVPVDLNSILYMNEVAIGRFLDKMGNKTEGKKWADMAKQRSADMFAVLWNETLFSYFDYNLTSNAQNRFVPTDASSTVEEQSAAMLGDQALFHVAQLYPFWTGAAPDSIKNNPLAMMRVYSRVASSLARFPGGVAATNYRTTQQWDEPNVWPPHQQILMQGLLNTKATFGTSDPAWKELQDLALIIGQRYVTSAFCTWYATGGSTSKTPRLSGLPSSAKGNMFEKYAQDNTNYAGGGGEYKVAVGFGWSNGVLLWTVDTFGKKLKTPDCGSIKPANVSAFTVDRWDATWVKAFP